MRGRDGANGPLIDAAHEAAWHLRRASQAAIDAAFAAGRALEDVEAVRIAVAEYRGGLDVLARLLEASGTRGLFPPPSSEVLRRVKAESCLKDWIKERTT